MGHGLSGHWVNRGFKTDGQVNWLEMCVKRVPAVGHVGQSQRAPPYQGRLGLVSGDGSHQSGGNRHGPDVLGPLGGWRGHRRLGWKRFWHHFGKTHGPYMGCQ
jgi:hypothetical protein